VDQVSGEFEIVGHGHHSLVIAVMFDASASVEMTPSRGIAARGCGVAANAFVVPGAKRLDHRSRFRDRILVQQNTPILWAHVECAEHCRAPLIHSDLEKSLPATPARVLRS